MLLNCRADPLKPYGLVAFWADNRRAEWQLLARRMRAPVAKLNLARGIWLPIGVASRVFSSWAQQDNSWVYGVAAHLIGLRVLCV